MTKYVLFFDGLRISVYSLFDVPSDTKEFIGEISEGEIVLLIYPVSSADIGATCLDRTGEILIDPQLLLAALSFFFGVIRNLPSNTIELLFGGRIYEIPDHGKESIITVNSKQCKVKSTICVEFADGVELDADLVDYEYYCSCVFCHDCELLDYDRLLRLGGMMGIGVGAPAVAVSYDGVMTIRTVGDIMFPHAIAVAAKCLLYHGVELPTGRVKAKVNGDLHDLALLGDVIELYPKIVYSY